MRTRREVINTILAYMGTTDHVGLAVEPIAMVEDPENITDADFVIRACIPFAVEGESRKFFVSIFQCSICMDHFQNMNEERFDYNMDQIVEKIEELRRQVAERGEGIDAINAGELFNMGRVAKAGFDALNAKDKGEQ